MSSSLAFPTETECLQRSTGDLPNELVIPIFIVLLIITMASVCTSIILAVCLIKQRQSQGKRRNDHPSNLYEITDKHELIAREGGSPTDAGNYETVQDPRGIKNYRFDKY